MPTTVNLNHPNKGLTSNWQQGAVRPGLWHHCARLLQQHHSYLLAGCSAKQIMLLAWQAAHGQLELELQLADSPR